MVDKHFDPYKIDIKELAIYITDRCDKNCLHCFIPKKNNDINPQWIQQLVDHFPIRKTVIIGGEPTISSVLPSVIKILKDAKVDITMSTNCQWMRDKNTKEKALEKMKGVDSVQICLFPDTLIQLSNGEIQKVDEKKINNVIGYNFDKMKYQNAKCSRYIKRKEKEILRIKTRTNEILVTGQYKFPIITRDGKYTEKKAIDLDKNDYLLSPKKIMLKGKKQKLKKVEKIGCRSTLITLPDFTSNDFCQFLGYVIGDGLNTQKRRAHVSVYDKNKDILLRYKEIGEKLFDKKATIRKYNLQNTYELCFSSAILFDFFSNFDIKKSAERRVPKIIFKVTSEELGYFLAGYYDAEGCISKNEVIVSSASYDLIREIHMLLRRFGIVGSIIKKPRSFGFGSEKGYIYYILNISSKATVKSFFDNIGKHMLHPKKRKKIETLAKKCNHSYFYECYPINVLFESIFKGLIPSKNLYNYSKTVSINKLQKSLDYIETKIKNSEILVNQKEIGKRMDISQQHVSYLINKKNKHKKGAEKVKKAIGDIIEEKIKKARKKIELLQKIVDSFYFDKIIRIEKEEYKGYVYDLTIPKTNNFIANNILTHNSIEGSKRTTDKIRGKGTYNDCMKAVDLLKKEGFDVFFRATYSNNNFHEIPNMLKLATKKDVHLILFPYKGRDAIPLSTEQQETLYNTLMDYTEIDEEQGINHMALSNIPQYFTYIGQHGYCPAGRELLNLLPNGMITPCEMNMPPDHFLLGQFNGNTLDYDKLMNRIKIFLEYHKPIYQECMSCKYHRICRSGCHETKENMNCPLQHNIDFEKYFDVYNTDKHQVVSKAKSMKHIMNKRKGC